MEKRARDRASVFFRVNYDAVSLDVKDNATASATSSAAAENSEARKRANLSLQAVIHLPIDQLQNVTAETQYPIPSALETDNASEPELNKPTSSTSKQPGPSSSSTAVPATHSRSNTPVTNSPRRTPTPFKSPVNIRGIKVNNHCRVTIPVCWSSESGCYIIAPLTELRRFEDVELWLIRFLKKVCSTPDVIASSSKPSTSTSSSSANPSLTYEIVGLDVEAWTTSEQFKAFLKLFMPSCAPVGYAELCFEKVLTKASPPKISPRKRKVATMTADGEEIFNEVNAEKSVRLRRTAAEKALFELACKDVSSMKKVERHENTLSVVTALLNVSADSATIDAVEESALIGAVKMKKHKVVKALLLNNAFIYCRDAEAQTPLHCAARNGDFSCVKLLWRAANAKSTFVPDPVDIRLRTPLMLAVESKHIDVVHFLLEKGANVTHRDRENETVLHKLVRGGFDKDIAKLLVEAGCPIEAVNTDGFSASSLAANNLVVYSIPPRDRIIKTVEIQSHACDMFFSTAHHRQSQGMIVLNLSNVKRRPDFEYQFGLTIERETEAFVQIKSSWVSTNYCKCVGPCSLQQGCTCMEIHNKGRRVFDSRGRLELDLPPSQPIVTCPAFCPCTVDCPLRSLQNAVGPRLEIFQDAETNVWHTRPVDNLEAGQFVCFLGGEIIHPRFMNLDKPHRYIVFSHTLSVDISKKANASRFFGDSALQPNVRIAVVREYDCSKPPQIAFFANEWIKKGEVLTYDRHVAFDAVQRALRDRAFSGFQFDQRS